MKIRCCYFFVFCLMPISTYAAQDSACERVVMLQKLYNGSEVKSLKDAEQYKGIAAVGRIKGLWRKKAYVFNYEQLAANYGYGVEFQLREHQIILCPETKDYIYNGFTSKDIRYVKNSRPELEKLVQKITADCKTNQEKTLALMRFCRDLKEKDTIKWGTGYVFGGTEEYIIEKGSDICECLSRLYVSLCEIAGLPARIVMHDIAGHIVAEVCVDGKWGYVDPKFGLYFLKKDGRLASTWEIWTNPDLMHAQNEAVKADLKGKLNWPKRIEKCEKKYFHINEVFGFQNYSLSDSSKYTFSTVSWDEATRAGLFRVNKAYGAASRQVFGLNKNKDNQSIKAKKMAKANRCLASYIPDSLEYHSKGLQDAVTFLRSFTINIDSKNKSLEKLNAKLFCSIRPLVKDEKLEVFVNGQGPVIASDVDNNKNLDNKVEYKFKINPAWLWGGDNVVRFVCRSESGDRIIDLGYEKIELLLTSDDGSEL